MMHDTESHTLSSQALPPGTRIQEFVIERVLGSGGFGITYLAKDTRLDRQVVIKENLPAQFCFRDTYSLTVAPRHTHGDDVDNFQWSLENFSKESAMLASLDHPGIVKVLRSFESFGTAYFVMPYVDGVTLDKMVKQRGGNAFSEEELRGLLERTLSALAYLHERGIYHRDIKPGNILIARDGIPVLIDFGSARQCLSERSLTVVESAGYTPFEQLQSRGNVGAWSDLYALAATLVKVITGETPPKTNDRTMGDPWQPLTGRVDLVGRYSEVFLRCLDRALRLPIEERWQTAGDWSVALAGGVVSEVDSHSGDHSTISSAKVSTNKPSFGLRWSFAAVAFLAVTAVGAWHLSRKEPEQVPAAVTAPLTGGLVITSDPLGAELANSTGEVLGKTPVELTGLAGGQPWQGTLAMDGYDTADVKAEVVPDETKLVAPVKLKPQAQKVIISSEPSDAEVVEGDKVLGRTPWESNPREVGESVVLTLRKEGYDEAQVSGEVLFGKSLILQGTLKAKQQEVVVTSEPTAMENLNLQHPRVMVSNESTGAEGLKLLPLSSNDSFMQDSENISNDSSKNKKLSQPDPENYKLALEYHRYINALRLKRVSSVQFMEKHYDKKTNKFLIPPKSSWRRMGYTLRVVERVAQEMGVAKVIVISGYRLSGSCCSRYDSPSWHRQNIAVDFVFDGKLPKEVAAMARQLRDEGLFRGGVGDLEKYTHIDARGENINW
jgi:serine/threonine protein kinase